MKPPLHLNLRGKRCLVVGAGAGIGLAFTRLLLARGALVVAASRNTSKLNSLAKRYPRRCHILTINIDSYAAALKLATLTKRHLVTADIFFSSIGLVAYKQFTLFSEREIRKVVETNLLIPLFLLRAILPLMLRSRRRKVVIQVGSLAGIAPGHSQFSIYSASKEALAGLFRSLQAEYESTVQFILVCPSVVKQSSCKQAIGRRAIRRKLARSEGDSPRKVASGILENLAGEIPYNDVRLLPTPLAKQRHAQLLLQTYHSR